MRTFDGSRDFVVAADEYFRHGETGEGAKEVSSFGDERTDDVGETVGGDLREEKEERKGDISYQLHDWKQQNSGKT